MKKWVIFLLIFVFLYGCGYELDDKLSCQTDSDCVPAQCCHPTSVINSKYAPNCKGTICTAVCTGPLDCGAGHPECVNERCIIIKDSENENKEIIIYEQEKR